MADTITEITSTNQETKDALDDPDTTQDLTFKKQTEKIKVEEGATIIKSRDTTSDKIWGIFVWGTDTWDDGTHNQSQITKRIVNPNDIHNEHFADTTFKDTTNTTANWDTTNLRCSIL